MLDRAVAEDFLDCQLEGMDIEIPEDISKDALVEAFCQYTEDDYHEWLKANFESCFDHGNLDRERQEIQTLLRKGNIKYKMTNQKLARNSNFIQRAQALRKKIKARTGTNFDISALIDESRRRRNVKQ